MRNNLLPRKTKALTAVSLSFASVLCITSAQAGCERDDVAYYLKEGFTPEQITTICAGTPNQQNGSNPASQPIDKPAAPTTQTITPAQEAPPASATNVESVAKPSSDLETKLQSLINGDKITLTDATLGYVQKICLSYEYDAYYPPTQVVCPKTEVTIQRSGLTVVKAEKVLFEGSQVSVKGIITKTLLETFDEKDADEQKLILDAFRDNGSINIKVKNKSSAKELANLLREISK